MSDNIYTIAEHWDPDGNITATSDAHLEFLIWKTHAEKNPADWNGTEFTLEDFETYISELGRINQTNRINTPEDEQLLGIIAKMHHREDAENQEALREIHRRNQQD